MLGVPIGTVDSVPRPAPTSWSRCPTTPRCRSPPRRRRSSSPRPSSATGTSSSPRRTPVARLADNATLEADRTAVPLELDQIYENLDKLNVALGPNGANRNGALSDLLEVTAANFGGQGERFHQTIEDFGKFSDTLSDNREEFFSSTRSLQGFISTLAENDATVRRFNQSMADVSTVLEGEREELSAALENLSVALGQVSTFVRDNREILGRNIKGLNRVSKVLVKQRAALDEILTVAPTALNNLALTYNPQAGTLDTRSNLGEIGYQITSDPATYLCGFVSQADTSGAAVRPIQEAFPEPVRSPASRARTLGGATSSTRPSADSWRCLDEPPEGPRDHRRFRSRPDRAALASTSCRCPAAPTSATTRSGDRGVRRRPRPGAAVHGQGQRRQRRQDHRDRARGETAVVTMRAAERRRAARQRGRRDPADQPAGREVRVARARRSPGPAPSRSRRRPDRARPTPAATPRSRRSWVR